MAFVTKFRNVQTWLITFIRSNSGKDKLLAEIDFLVYFCIYPAFTQVTNMYWVLIVQTCDQAQELEDEDRQAPWSQEFTVEEGATDLKHLIVNRSLNYSDDTFIPENYMWASNSWRRSK